MEKCECMSLIASEYFVASWHFTNECIHGAARWEYAAILRQLQSIKHALVPF